VPHDPEPSATHSVEHDGPLAGSIREVGALVTVAAVLCPGTVALSETSSTDPTSLDVNTYVLPVAAGMLTHPAPVGSQLSH
jgi:hypothetical protein